MRAALNVRQWAQWALDSGNLQPITHPINKKWKTDSRHLLIGFRCVFKTYLKKTPAQLDALRQFYKAVVGNARIEQAEEEKAEQGQLSLRLTPVGVQRLPRTEEEAQRCFRDILAGLGRCHELKSVWWFVICALMPFFAHTAFVHSLIDIRWPNVIERFGRWYLIDAEYAAVEGTPFPEGLKDVLPGAQTCSPESDLYMVGRLLQQLEDRVLGTEGKKLRDVLLSEKRREWTATRLATGHAWLARLRD